VYQLSQKAQSPVVRRKLSFFIAMKSVKGDQRNGTKCPRKSQKPAAEWETGRSERIDMIVCSRDKASGLDVVRNVMAMTWMKSTGWSSN
jgi:hypothetical protein